MKAINIKSIRQKSLRGFTRTPTLASFFDKVGTLKNIFTCRRSDLTVGSEKFKKHLSMPKLVCGFTRTPKFGVTLRSKGGFTHTPTLKLNLFGSSSISLQDNHKFTPHTKRKLVCGFTLVEIIVAVGIFSLVMMISIGAVLAIVGANKKAQSLHNVLNNLNLAIETMVRDMRTGYGYESDGLYVTFQSTQSGDKTVTYNFVEEDNGYITKSVNGASPDRITSEDVAVKNLSFRLFGDESPSEDDFNQPKVLVIIQGEAKANGAISKFNIQTLVSQRRLDI